MMYPRPSHIPQRRLVHVEIEVLPATHLVDPSDAVLAGYRPGYRVQRAARRWTLRLRPSVRLPSEQLDEVPASEEAVNALLLGADREEAELGTEDVLTVPGARHQPQMGAISRVDGRAGSNMCEVLAAHRVNHTLRSSRSASVSPTGRA